MARLHALQAAVANGTVDLSKGIPAHLMPKGAAGARLEAALGWADELGGEEDDEEESYAAQLHARHAAAEWASGAKPRVLDEAAAAADVPIRPKDAKGGGSDAEAAAAKPVAKPAEASGGAHAKPSMPALNLSVMNDPDKRPEGYHDEFTRMTAGAPVADERSKEVDAMLYSHDPMHGKTFAAAAAAGGEEGGKEGAKAPTAKPPAETRPPPPEAGGKPEGQ